MRIRTEGQIHAKTYPSQTTPARLLHRTYNHFRNCVDSPAVFLQSESKMAEGPPVPKQSERTEEISQPTYDLPVYREISFTYGQINKMKKEEVKRCLVERGLDSR